MHIKDKFEGWVCEDKNIIMVLEDYFGEIFQSSRPSDKNLEAATKHIGVDSPVGT